MGLVGNPEVSKRLETVSKLIKQYENLGKFLELERDVLKVQLEIEKNQVKEAFLGKLEGLSFEELMRESLKAKTPMNLLIDAAVFDSSHLCAPFMQILNILMENNIDREASKKLLRAIQAREISLTKLIEATLREDETPLKGYASTLSIQPTLLVYAVSSVLRPFFEEIARRVDPSFYDRWWEARCPICGRTPNIAKIKQRRRYLVCTLCGAEYLSDYFLCVHCKNRDPSTLKYLSDEKEPRFRIDFCTKCMSYLKVLDEDSIGNMIPKGFEDILTLSLDLIAINKGLKRS